MEGPCEAQLLQGLVEAGAALLELQLALVELQLVELLLAREAGPRGGRGGVRGGGEQKAGQKREPRPHSTYPISRRSSAWREM